VRGLGQKEAPAGRGACRRALLGQGYIRWIRRRSAWRPRSPALLPTAGKGDAAGDDDDDKREGAGELVAAGLTVLEGGGQQTQPDDQGDDGEDSSDPARHAGQGSSLMSLSAPFGAGWLIWSMMDW